MKKRLDTLPPRSEDLREWSRRPQALWSRKPKRKQTVLESAARDHNWLLGRLREAETRFNKALWAALEYADQGYFETCRRERLQANRSKVYAYQRAVSSMARDAENQVRDRFKWIKLVQIIQRPELSRDAIVEPTQDFSPNAKDATSP